MMTQKHFQQIADVLNDEMENMETFDTREVFLNGKAAGIEAVARSMADMLGKQNPRFNREKFLTACGLS